MNFDGSLEPGDMFYSVQADDHVIIVELTLSVGLPQQYTIVNVYYQKLMKHQKYHIRSIHFNIENGHWKRV